MMSLFALTSGAHDYSSTGVASLLAVGVLLLVLSSVVRRKRRSFQGTVKALSKTWPSALLLFGAVGVALGVCRAEGVPFFSMPLLAVLWAILLVVVASLHVFLYRKRSYTIIPSQKTIDPREQFLPKRRKR